MQAGGTQLECSWIVQYGQNAAKLAQAIFGGCIDETTVAKLVNNAVLRCKASVFPEQVVHYL